MSVPVALQGRQEPRLHLLPACWSCAADEAVRLYGLLGRRLDPWQETALRTGLGETRGGTWASFENGLICQRQNGKGIPIEALCLAALFLWGAQVVIYSAHRLTTVRKAFRSVRSLIEAHPDFVRRCKPINYSDDVIELRGGGRLEFHTRTRSGGRGLTGDVVVLDEALELAEDQIAALVPILLAIPNAQLWYVSTVPQDADAHLCAVRRRVLAGEPGLSWAEWGVERDVAERLGYDSPEVLAAANPAVGRRLGFDRLRQMRKILGDAVFAAECLGIWPVAAPGAVFAEEPWRGMCDPGSRRVGDVVLSLDVTPSRDHATVGVHGLRGDGLEHVQLLDHRPGVDWVVGRCAQWREVLDPLLWVVDRNNGAYALREDLRAAGIFEADDPQALHRGALLALDAGQAAEAVAQFIDAFRREPSVLRHVGQDPLDAAVRNVRLRPIGDSGKVGYGRLRSEVDIGPVVAVTQARYGRGVWALRGAAVADYDVLESVAAADGQCPGCDAFSPNGGPIEHYDDCTLTTSGASVGRMVRGGVVR